MPERTRPAGRPAERETGRPAEHEAERQAQREADAGDREYPGGELELFRHAVNWKRYWSARVAAHLGADVLEVGAGIGANTEWLLGPTQLRWTCVEPDPELRARLVEATAALEGGERVVVRGGTVADLPADSLHDTVLYLDVLEHVEDDGGELERVARHLRPGGRLVVLAPAHEWLRSPFDDAVGHFRRYDRASIQRVVPDGFERLELRHLDAVGLAASLANRLLLKASQPTPAQIRTWDRWLVPPSRLVDPLTLHRLGRSLLGVWRYSSPDM